jgi:hypothetical protein
VAEVAGVVLGGWIVFWGVLYGLKALVGASAWIARSERRARALDGLAHGLGTDPERTGRGRHVEVVGKVRAPYRAVASKVKLAAKVVDN